jgi:uncharacterized protein YraI
MKPNTALSLLIGAGLLMVGCSANATVLQQDTPTPVLPRAVASASPTINVRPTTAAANMQMTVTGSGFPAGVRVRVYLGVANASVSPQSYAEAVADTDGRLAFAFAMPGQWPNGSPIIEQELTLVVANQDFSLKATAPFSFEPAVTSQPAPTRPPPTPAPNVTITPTSEPTARVNYEFLNVRSGPGTSFSLIATLKQDDTVSLMGRNDDGKWVRIRLPDGREGWSYTEYLKASLEIASLPVSSATQPQGPGLPASTAAPLPASEKEAALVSTVNFYTLWASGAPPNGKLEALQYVSKALANQIRADDSYLLRTLRVPGRPQYTQVELLRDDGTTVLMRATLQLDGESRVVDTTLGREDGRWVIVQFQPVGQ